MLLQIRGKYMDTVHVECKSFSLSNYSKELEIHFDDLPDKATLGILTEIGFRTVWSTHVFTIDPSLITTIRSL